MSHNLLEPQSKTVGELFDHKNGRYVVPIYQRNFTWDALQIEQLLRDIQDAIRDKKNHYFLGNLVVTRVDKDANTFEVIDGQQRLTTLYVLLSFLGKSGSPNSVHQDCLSYASRPRATAALRRIANESTKLQAPADPSNAEDSGILQCYKVISQFMDQCIKDGAERASFSRFLRNQTTLVRASLPSRTDFNRYFEIMNTRGQQLQQADIVKARLMQKLADPSQRACFAWIWEACADMDSYVQMNLTRGKTDLRTEIFGSDWSQLTLVDFQKLVEIHPTSLPEDTMHADVNGNASLNLDDAIQKYAHMGGLVDAEDAENERFRSIIDFPTFLLHVLKLMDTTDHEDEGQLDDKLLVKQFELKNFDMQEVQRFAYKLLRCRNLFDSYILKREYTGLQNEEGDWSLQRLIKRPNNKQNSVSYRSTFADGHNRDEIDAVNGTKAKDLLMLQSMLRITYTSPRTMHWITKLLRVLDASDPARLKQESLAEVLRTYARGKVEAAFFNGQEPTGFGIARIVFTYLDYLLWLRAGSPEFKFVFRSSIEHFYPQNPDTQQTGDRVSEESLHRFGNLALVSVGVNSKFSNSIPLVKAMSFPSIIEVQSLKLHHMAEIARQEGKWGDAQVNAHHKAMVDCLRLDLSLCVKDGLSPNN